MQRSPVETRDPSVTGGFPECNKVFPGAEAEPSARDWRNEPSALGFAKRSRPIGMTPMREHMHSHDDEMAIRNYLMFAVNMAVSLVAMYFVMFSMIDGWSDFRNNLNMAYMALTMVAPMGILMLLTMSGMYTRKRLNVALYVAFGLLFIAALAATRSQTLIGDRQFIASMIPHHSGAILMCRKAKLIEPELVKLCSEISEGQRKEIEQMKAIRVRLDSGNRA